MENSKLMNKQLKEIYCSTYVNPIKLKYEWKINNFSILSKKNDEFFVSPLFSVSSKSDYKWFLTFFPNGKGSDYEGYVSLFLDLEVKLHKVYKPIDTKFELYVLDKKNEKSVEQVLSYTFEVLKTAYGYAKMMKLKTLEKNYLVDDCLTICCDITFMMPEHCTRIQATKSINNVNDTEKKCQYLNQFFESLFIDQKLCDVVLVTSGHKFNAHKAVLAAHSPVFYAMFNHEMKEKQTSEVMLDDTCSEVLTEVLRFMYSRKIENLPRLINDLLIVADKYEIDTLKDECEKHLCDNLSLGNVIYAIQLADYYNASKLKKEAIKLLVNEGSSLVGTDEFKHIGNLKSSTFVEIAEALLSKVK